MLRPFKRGAISAQVLNLAWPVVVEQVLATAVGLVNTYIVSHLGAAALTAVGLSSQVNFLLQALFSAVGVGSTALVARHIGAGQPEEAERIAGQSLLLAVAVGLLTALPCLLWARPLVRALGGGEDVVALGQPYLVALGTTMPLMSLLFIGSAVLRGAGNTRTPMVVMALVNLVNVVVSCSLVYGLGPFPALGVLGAGIGAAAGVGVGGLVVTGILLRGGLKCGLRVPLAALRPDLARSWRLMRIGLPSGAEQAILRGGQLTLSTIVTHLGTAAYAGHQLGIQLLALAFMPGFAFSVAATTLVGQELGRGSPERATACARTASRMALAVMCVVGAVGFVFAEPLLRLFTSEPDVIAQGLYAVWGCVVMEPPLAWYYVYSGALRGAGDTRFVLLAQALPIWLIRLPLASRLGLTFGLGMAGVWTAMNLDMVVRALVLILRFRGGAWKRIRV